MIQVIEILKKFYNMILVFRYNQYAFDTYACLKKIEKILNKYKIKRKIKYDWILLSILMIKYVREKTKISFNIFILLRLVLSYALNFF